MLMNMGCLVTIAGNPADICVVVINNGVYEVTGGQKTAGSGAIRFAEIARASGIEQSYAFETTEDWSREAAGLLKKNGPVCIELVVDPLDGPPTPGSPRPMAEQISRLRSVLDIGVR
jgi:thiamine pyrophosphate-dependent acetolactate synthase large subunit-like protein